MLSVSCEPIDECIHSCLVRSFLGRGASLFSYVCGTSFFVKGGSGRHELRTIGSERRRRAIVEIVESRSERRPSLKELGVDKRARPEVVGDILFCGGGVP